MRIHRLLPFFLAVAFLTPEAAASAQSVLAGGAIQYDLQRFSGDPALNRLDGAARGWTILGGVDPGPHVALRIEGSWSGTIENTQVTNLNIDGQPLTVRSSLSHDARSVAALAGYTHAASSRVQLAYLAGVSFTTVHRTFTTDAAQILLVNPSAPAPSSSTSTMVDRFAVFDLGADAYVRAVAHLYITAGIRAQPLKLQADLSGYSVRALGGVSWRSR